jgi:hypothetical protein
MKLRDTIYNTEIVYLYVNKFDWGKNQMGKEDCSGHPKSKKLYRAIYNKDTHSYRVIYGISAKNQLEATFIENLQSKDFDEHGYTCDIIVLSKKTILDCNLSEEELDQLNQWQTTDNKDVKDITGNIGEKKTDKAEGTTKKAEMKESNQQLPEEFAQFLGISAHLHNTDPLTFGTIFDLILYLNDTQYQASGPLDGHWMKMDKEYGAGVNISAAVEKLNRYMGQNRRTNLENEDLMGAIKDLITESNRRTYQGVQ